MAHTNKNVTPTQPPVVCKHKPGDVWADGCCTSQKNISQQAPEPGDIPVNPENTALGN